MEHNELSKKMEEKEIQIEPEIKKHDLYTNIKNIKNLKTEIVELKDSIIEVKDIPLVMNEIREKEKSLHKRTELAFKYAETERKENPKFLKSINLDKINNVYIHKKYSKAIGDSIFPGKWKTYVHMDDFIEMKRKKGLNALEFKDCDISSVLFNEKFENCKFENCILSKCTLKNAEFVNMTFKNVTFNKVVLQNVKFENCKFENCDSFSFDPSDEKSVNIEFVNTDIKASQIDFDNTNIDLKSVCFKNCPIENLEFSINLLNFDQYHSQLMTKNVKEQSLMKLMDRKLRKSLKHDETTVQKRKKAKCR